MQYEVQDVGRRLRFDGTLLAHSTSWRQGSSRWAEFFLYRTAKGHYILNRIGFSLMFHRTECSIAERNRLKISEAADLDSDAVPCEVCVPERKGTICPEEPRPWAQSYDKAVGVVEGCLKEDKDNGTYYFTYVARRLLEQASNQDEAIADAYLVETVE